MKDWGTTALEGIRWEIIYYLRRRLSKQTSGSKSERTITSEEREEERGTSFCPLSSTDPVHMTRQIHKHMFTHKLQPFCWCLHQCLGFSVVPPQTLMRHRSRDQTDMLRVTTWTGLWGKGRISLIEQLDSVCTTRPTEKGVSAVITWIIEHLCGIQTHWRLWVFCLHLSAPGPSFINPKEAHVVMQCWSVFSL